MVLDHLEEFAVSLRSPRAVRSRPPMRVVKHLQRFLECGIVRFGAMRFRCPRCAQSLFVAFSCKRRGFCPHCDAKRAAIIMSDASDRLLPEAGYRQYVLTIPKRLRWFVNQDAALPGEISRILAREIERLLSRRSAGASAAQLHFIQRAGRSLNLHPHVHAVVSEGRFSAGGLLGRGLRFHAAPPPSKRDIELMTESLRRKILRRLRRLNAIPGDMAENMLAWPNSGFSVHAEVFVPPGDRKGLERLLYYCAKPALSPMKLSYSPKESLVVYRSEAKNGLALPLSFEPVEFLRRWGLLIPPPRKNLLRYYGALGPNSKLRPLLVAKASRGAAKARLRARVDGVKEEVSASLRSWAACLSRVFEVDPLVCPQCGERMVAVAAILKDSEVTRILECLGLPTEFPKTKPARTKLAEVMLGPPGPDRALGDECQLDPRTDLYEAVDPPADDFHAA